MLSSDQVHIIYLSICLYIYPFTSINPSIHPSVFQSIDLSIYRSNHMSIRIYLFWSEDRIGEKSTATKHRWHCADVILTFLEKGNLGNSKNNTCITLTAASGKVHKALLLNRIWPEIEKSGFRRTPSLASQILTIRRNIKRARAKNFVAIPLFLAFSRVFDSIHGEKTEQILLAYGLPKKNCYHE